jgi:hypothetical protein
MTETDNELNFKMIVEFLVARYRAGFPARVIFRDLDELSQEWERHGLECRIPSHGRPRQEGLIGTSGA